MIEGILAHVNSFVTAFNAYAKDYQFVAGAFSVWMLGVLSYLMRNVPKNIYDFLYKHLTTKMTITSSHEAYHNFLRWLKVNGYLKRARSFKISCGMWGWDKSTNSIGYGKHYFMYGCRPFTINMEQKETHSTHERDEITITILGRSNKFFTKIFKEIGRIDKDATMLPIHKYYECWTHIAGQRKRSLDKVFIDKDAKISIIDHIRKFNDNEEWYVSNGLSYQTGILLYGPPGTGKTSVVKAIASHFEKDLYILSVSNLKDIEKAFSQLPEKSVLLIEDIDTDGATHGRRKKSENGPKPVDATANTTIDTTVEDALFSFSFSNLSDVLNTIDGVVSSHGRILIATTNHIEKLDSALLRPGRFDLKVRLDYTSNDVIRQFFNNYYPGFAVPASFNVKEKTAPADVQNLILNNLDSPEKVLSELKD